MDPASLALASIVLIKPLCTTINTTLANYSHYARDAESLRRRFSIQCARLESFESLLYIEDRLVPGRLIDKLSGSSQSALLGLVEELRSAFQSYAALKMHRELSSSDSNGSNAGLTGGITDQDMSHHSDDAGLSTTLNIVPVLTRSQTLSDPLAVTKLKLVSTSRRIRWSIGRRDTAEGIVADFENWTDRVRALLEPDIWAVPICSTPEQLRDLRRDEDASNAGLLEGIRIRELLATPPVFIESTEPQLQGFYSGAFHKAYHAPGCFEIGSLDHKEGMFLIEQKSGRAAGTDDMSGAARRQVIHLGALLRDAPAADQSLQVLPCTGYIEDLSSGALGLVYALPNTYTAASLPPKSLSDVLQGRSRPKTSLDARIRIATGLLYSVHRLHVYGWFHKSLRSDNVLFFPLDPSDESRGYNLNDPKILGFEWARKENEVSPAEPGVEIRQNVYRHPDRWGQPTVGFGKVHDVYGESH